MTPKLREVPMSAQPKLIERTPEEREKMRLELAQLAGEYMHIEFQKSMMMRDYNQQLAAIWERMAKLDAGIKER